MVLMYCRKGIVGELFNSGGRLLQGFTIVFGPYFQLALIPYSQISGPQLGLQLPSLSPHMLLL
jgi:hypothetical protein